MERENNIPPRVPISIQTPLLSSTQIQRSQQPPQRRVTNAVDVDEEKTDTNLDEALRQLEFYLRLLGFRQTSLLSFVLSWIAFLVVGVGIPVTILDLSSCSGCKEYQVKEFEYDCLVSQNCLGAISLFCLSHQLRKYGVRRFLFVDRYSGRVSQLIDQYTQIILNHYGMLIKWLLPCLILKAAREILRIFYAGNESWWTSAAIVLALVISWAYVSTINLAACLMFHLVCSFQVIHFEEYCKSLEMESDILVLIAEHVRLRYNLSKISHRFRIYLLLLFLVVTAGQFVTLFQIMVYSGTITFLNGGDFAVTSVVQVVGITLCLHAATKISLRAQNIGSAANKWHALVTCRVPEQPPYSGRTICMDSLEGANPTASLSRLSNGRGSLESFNYRIRRSKHSISMNNLYAVDHRASHSRHSNSLNSLEAADHRGSLSARHSSSMNNLEAADQRASHSRRSNSTSELENRNGVGSPVIPRNTSETDLDSLDSWTFNNSQLASLASTYHMRESFLAYLETNPGGLTIYGWKVDRTLISTIFGLELTLVCFLAQNILVL